MSALEPLGLTDIGGGFGGKVPVYPGYVCAVVAALTTGRPVKWIEDRTENLQADSFARDYHIHAELAADNSGKMEALPGASRIAARSVSRRRCIPSNAWSTPWL